MVRRCRSIREAARRLNVASSAVNRQILKLEAEIGVPLFDRLPGGLQLTAAGEVLSRHVINVLQDGERVVSEIEAMKGLRSGHVEVATVEGLTMDFLPQLVARSLERYPRITIGVSSTGSPRVPEMLLQGEADVGLAFDLPRDSSLRQVAMGEFHLGAIMRPDHPLAERAQVTLAQCADHRLLVAKPSLSMYRTVMPILESLNPAQEIVSSDSITLVRELAMSGVGIGFQTRIGIERQIAAGELVHVPLHHNRKPLMSELAIYVRAGRNVPVGVDAFLRFAEEEILRRSVEAKGSAGRKAK